MIGPRVNKDAEAFASALEGRGPRDSEVQQLVRFAQSLCESAVDPAPEFVRNLRADLMAEAASVLVVVPRTPRTATVMQSPHPVRKRVAAATAGVLATAGMLGIVASSAQALPGEMLYPVKRGVESIELTLHRSDADRGSFELGQATKRLAEADSLAGNGDNGSDKLAAESLTAFAGKANAGSAELFADYAKGGNDASIYKVNKFATASSTTLAGLAGRLSPDARDAFQVAASTVTGLAAQASSLCAACNTAELTSLANTVASFVNETNKELAAKKQSAASKAAAGTDSTTAPPKLPAVKPPAAPTPQQLKDTTKPIVGALLGDEDQDGLVPGLLGEVPGDVKK